MKKSRSLFGVDIDSMKFRMRRTLLAVSIFLTLAMSVLGYKAFENTLVTEAGNNRADVLSQIGDRVKQVRYNAYTLSNLYYYGHTLRTYLEDMESLNGREKARTVGDFNRYMDRLTTQYKSSFHKSSQTFHVVLALEDGEGYSSNGSGGDDYMSPKAKIWYKKMLFARGGVINIANYKDKKNDESYYSVARCIESEDGSPMAYLMVSMEEQQIHSMYETMTEGDQNAIHVVDEEGTIISSSNRKLNRFNFFHMKNLEKLFDGGSYTITRMRGEAILFIRYSVPDTGFTMLEETPLVMLMESIRQVRFVIICLAVVATGLAVLYAGHFADTTTRPISELCDFLLQVEGNNLDKECMVEGYTEITILSSQLDMVLGRTRMLMAGIKQKEQQKRKMELGFLQVQINPHFTYNTLFSIKCMVDMEKNEETSRMPVFLIQLLRSTLSNPNEFVTIRQEFHVLQQYADIQKFCYDDNFQVALECDEAVELKKIPKLLIQSLLENAIFHGVEFRKGEGMIIITAREKDGGMVATVEDSGMGTQPEVIEKINRGEQISERTHVGILNVKERIQLNFDEDYGMKIESTQWMGTRIILAFPAID